MQIDIKRRSDTIKQEISGLIKYNLTDKRFGKLLAIEYVGDSKWKCICDCGEYKDCDAYALINGYNKTCGKCKNNEYIFIEDYVQIIDKKGLSFYIDIIDFKNVSMHTWWVARKDGRVYAKMGNKNESLHRFILNYPKNVIDHIDRNPSNNRRNNLRECTSQENSCNLKIRKTNTSGVTGVWYNNHCNTWMAEIKYKQKSIKIPCRNFITAVRERIRLEVQYFKEFRGTSNDELLEKLLFDSGYNFKELIESTNNI